MDAELIVDDTGRRRAARAILEELIDELRPTAASLGAEAELDDLLALWTIGPSYLRQRRVLEQGGSPRDVVESLVRELETDQPRPEGTGGDQ